MDLSTWRAWTSAPKVNTSVFYRPQLNTTAVLHVSRHAAAQTRRRKHRGREEWVQAGFGELHRRQSPISVVCFRSSRFPQWKNNYILSFFNFSLTFQSGPLSGQTDCGTCSDAHRARSVCQVFEASKLRIITPEKEHKKTHKLLLTKCQHLSCVSTGSRGIVSRLCLTFKYLSFII